MSEKATGGIQDEPAGSERLAVNQSTASEFERVASSASETSFLGEFWYFLAQNKKWWLAPMLLVLLAFVLLLTLSSSAAAPFIYTLF